MSAMPEITPLPIGHPTGWHPPEPPDVNAIGYALSLRGKAEVATGVVYRPLSDAEPEEPGADGFTKSERRAIALAANSLQRAHEALAEVVEALERAKSEAAGALPLAPTPSEELLRAHAYLGHEEPPPRRGRPPKAATNAEAARDAIAGLRALVGEREQGVKVARGELRLALIAAARAARTRAAARWHVVAESVAEAAAELAGLDAMLGHWVGGQALDGLWQRYSQLMAPPVELRPKGARVQECLARELVFWAEGPVADAATAKVEKRAEGALRKMLGDVVAWPF